MKKFLITAVATALLFSLLTTGSTEAAVRCETQYGGGEVCVRTGELQIDKEVFSSDLNKFVDNLGITSQKFAADDEIIFRLRVKNVGDETFSRVQVKDSLPGIFELTSGSLEFEIENLSPGETEEREVRARVLKDKLPSDKSIVCVVNEATAESDDESDKDTSQVCVEQKILGVTTLPKTGPSSLVLLLTSSLVAGLTGIYVIRSLKRLG